jgi:hypothetical protein
MKKLVKPDAAVFGGIAQQIAVQKHKAAANESGGVRGVTGRVAQTGAIADANRPAMEKIPDSLQ